jgi:hypothetical protein
MSYQLTKEISAKSNLKDNLAFQPGTGELVLKEKKRWRKIADE